MSVTAGRAQDAPLGLALYPQSSLMLAWAASRLPQLMGHHQPRCWAQALASAPGGPHK